MNAGSAPTPTAAATPGAVDELLRTAPVVVVLGPGGVGKTTLAAALALRAAEEHGRRVLVATIDPARRLAQALGVEQLPSEPVLVPLGPGSPGRLWALMVDMSRAWDGLVRRVAPDAAAGAALLADPLYRSLTTRFIQSHDYIALDLLCDLAGEGRFDLIVIDTPPASHALGVLDAPGRMVDLVDSRLLRWLVAPYRSRLARTTARPFLSVVERLLGRGFLTRVTEFFWLFTQIGPGLAARSGELRRRLDDPSTCYVVVTTAEPTAAEAGRRLVAELVARRHPPALLLRNRALPALGPDAARDLADPELARAVTALLHHDRASPDLGADGPGPPVAVHRVPWRPGPVTTVAELRALLGDDRGRHAR